MKGNIAINKSIAKGIENGRIIQNLPDVQFGGRMVTLFTPISPIQCSICQSPLKINEHYDRFIISSYGIIECPVPYWICSNTKCKKHHSDTIFGVTGSANYSDEYLRPDISVNPSVNISPTVRVFHRLHLPSIPHTFLLLNNVMEQLFSLMNDVMNQTRSFKINRCLANFCYNLFISLNNRIFNTGLWKGFSPLQRAKIKYN